jgi:hypothetical protein
MRRLLGDVDSAWHSLAAVAGPLAGLVQALGLLRWPFLVPVLSAAYVDPASTAATREAAVVVFAAFHAYAGVAVGEHLGYLLTGLWTIPTALALVRAGLTPRWLGWVGAVAGAGVLAGLAEPAGLPGAGAVNAAAYVLWALWLTAVGAALLISRASLARGRAGLSAQPT